MPNTPDSSLDRETLQWMHRTARAAFRNEDLAPAVDRNLLLALVRRQLSPNQARSVYQRIHAFRSWSEAHAEILIAEFRRQPLDPDCQSSDATA